MKKIDKFNKIIYTLLITFLSSLLFIININIPDLSYYSNRTEIYKFFTGIWLSLKEFDIIYVVLSIFIFYYFYKIYFNGNKFNKKSIINMIVSICITILLLICKSYKIDNTLNTLINSPLQIFKTIILGIGYYFIFYAIIKHILSIKIDKKTKKKTKKRNAIIEVIDEYPFILAFITILVYFVSSIGKVVVVVVVVVISLLGISLTFSIFKYA